MLNLKPGRPRLKPSGRLERPVPDSLSSVLRAELAERLLKRRPVTGETGPRPALPSPVPASDPEHRAP